MATIIEALEEVTVFPWASRTVTVGGPDRAFPAGVFPGWVVNTSWVAAPATTVKVTLSPAVKVSPLVRVAVMATPLSTLRIGDTTDRYLICPGGYSSRECATQARLFRFSVSRLIPVALITLRGFLRHLAACTTTGNPLPAVGFAPEFIDVIESLVGIAVAAALYVTIAAAHCRLALSVPLAEYAPVALTIRYSGLMVMLFAAVHRSCPRGPSLCNLHLL